MTEKEFINWLRGFVEGVHHYNLTPKQWDYLKEKLSKVGENSLTSSPYVTGNVTWFSSNT